MKAIKIIIVSSIFILFGCKKQIEKPIITSQYACLPVMSDSAWYKSNNKAPLFEDMGDLHYPITTKDSLVQRYFNQGLVLAYGFNHPEAARSFHYASRLDSTCAMTQWGYAYVLGPNYNSSGWMRPDNYEKAFNAIERAKKLAQKSGNEKELGLINALAKRYAKEPVENRRPLDSLYAVEMSKLYKKYPNDSEIGTLYAESLMNLHPWDLFDKFGNEKPWTPEIIKTLEEVIKKHPRSCGAHHFYIHAVEASKTAHRGLASAKLFDDGLVPNSGHLLHMSSHIYIRTGDYHKGTLANINAIKKDTAYINACNAQSSYPVAYYPHNQHFLVATAALEGNSKWAIYAADELSRTSSLQLMKEKGWETIQHFYTVPFFVYVKFGKWDAILNFDNKVPELDYPKAIQHYAKGMAFLRKGKIDKARQELEALTYFVDAKTFEDLKIWSINSMHDIASIAQKILRAEILATEKKYTESINILNEAIAIEDNLNYNEPPDWFFSVRHHLGAIQLDANLNEDAIKTYLTDLETFPKNGWALKGLSKAYSRVNNQEKLKETNELFEKVWATADVTLNSSVIK